MLLSRVVSRPVLLRSSTATTRWPSTLTTPSSAPTLQPPIPSIRSMSTSGKSYYQTIADPPSGIAKPGMKAFADVEYNAMVDLFHHHARDRGHLDRNTLFRLLESIGERPSEVEMDKIFELGDLDQNGVISLEEFLYCADTILGDAPARIVLVVGGPGSGKGLLSKRLEKECKVVHLSSGDLLRQEVERKTLLGQQVQSIMEKGELVSSAVIVALVRRRMRHHPGKRVLLDGFPRSLQNAEDMVELCGKPELALHLQCDDTVMLERILQRGERRADDNIQTALQRLRTYHKSHHVTMDWLRDQSVPIVNLDASGCPENVWDQLLAIGRLMRPACKVNPMQQATAEEEPDDKVRFF